jgi:hypothetical protein
MNANRMTETPRGRRQVRIALVIVGLLWLALLSTCCAALVTP